MPLDEDGFLPRACPVCNRAFRWLTSDNSAVPPDGRYGCPYCGARSDPSDFFTDDQAAYLTFEAGKYALQELEKSGLEVTVADAPAYPSISGDMLRLDFLCHPGEPVKIEREWVEARQLAFCLVCGSPNE